MNRKQLLITAASTGNIEACQFLLNNGASIETRDPTTAMTPLIAGAASGHFGVVRLLTKAGASVSAVCQLGETALIKGIAQVQKQKANRMMRKLLLLEKNPTQQLNTEPS
jgi:ankyrin repeat protein